MLQKNSLAFFADKAFNYIDLFSSIVSDITTFPGARGRLNKHSGSNFVFNIDFNVSFKDTLRVQHILWLLHQLQAILVIIHICYLLIYYNRSLYIVGC